VNMLSHTQTVDYCSDELSNTVIADSLDYDDHVALDFTHSLLL